MRFHFEFEIGGLLAGKFLGRKVARGIGGSGFGDALIGVGEDDEAEFFIIQVADFGEGHFASSGTAEKVAVGVGDAGRPAQNGLAVFHAAMFFGGGAGAAFQTVSADTGFRLSGVFGDFFHGDVLLQHGVNRGAQFRRGTKTDGALFHGAEDSTKVLC